MPNRPSLPQPLREALDERRANKEREKKNPPDSGYRRHHFKKRLGLIALVAGGAVTLTANHYGPGVDEAINSAPVPAASPANPQLEAVKPFVLPYEDCRVLEVTDLHKQTQKAKKGQPKTTTVKVKVLAHMTDQSTAAFKQHDTSVSWTPAVGVGALLESDSRHNLVPTGVVADDNRKGSADVKNGSGEITLYPPVHSSAALGVYILRTVQTEGASGQTAEFAGVTPCGMLEKVPHADGTSTWQIDQTHQSMVPAAAQVPAGVTEQQIIVGK
jgi:hypothetical protein